MTITVTRAGNGRTFKLGENTALAIAKAAEAKQEADRAATEANNVAGATARITALESLAMPVGGTALSTIAGALTVFDAREGLDIAAGKVREWKSQDRRLAAVQEAIAQRPVPSLLGAKLTFTAGDTKSAMLAYPKATLRRIAHLPDSSLRPFAAPKGGFVVTGAALRDDRKFILANDGRTSVNKSDWSDTGTGSDFATLIVADEGTLKIRNEWNLRDVVPGGFLTSVQGVDWTTDGTDYFYWVADTDAGLVRCLKHTVATGALTHVAANDITANHANGANLVAIDRANGEIYIGEAGNFSRVSVHTIATKAHLRTWRAIRDLDHGCFVNGRLWASSGGNGEEAGVGLYRPDGKLEGMYRRLVGSHAVEGIVVDPYTSQMHLFNDGNYHPQGPIDAAILCSYDITVPDAAMNYAPGRTLIAFVGNLASGGTTTFFGLEQSFGSTSFGGWGVYATGSGTISMVATQRDNGGAAVARTAAISTPNTVESIVVFDVKADGTVAARVNGVAKTVTGSLAGYLLGFGSLGMVLGGHRESAYTAGILSGGTKSLRAMYHGSLDDIAADEAAVTARITALEQALASRFGLSGLLP